MGAKPTDQTPAKGLPTRLSRRLAELRAAVVAAAAEGQQDWRDLPDDRRVSAGNLRHYLALREHDLGELHRALQAYGLTGLAGLLRMPATSKPITSGGAVAVPRMAATTTPGPAAAMAGETSMCRPLVSCSTRWSSRRTRHSSKDPSIGALK